MDLRRGWQYEYERSRGAGGGYGTPASFPAVPSLSTGQGFYTVESLQGATMLSPPQPVPSTTRVLPPLAPYARDFLPSPVLHSAHRGDFGPHERRYPTLPVVSRDLMTAPPQDMPYTRHGDGLHSPDIPPHRLPPPFMGDSRLPGVSPGRNEGQEPVSYTGQGPPPGRWMNSLGEPLVRTEKKKKVYVLEKEKKVTNTRATGC
ncbi:hypothetical protein L7F22_052057 [Adiantum nelumboides]|nr:hypothetical protein [Adiantum nelumboides]